jgi:hypothetical protein
MSVLTVKITKEKQTKKCWNFKIVEKKYNKEFLHSKKSVWTFKK